MGQKIALNELLLSWDRFVYLLIYRMFVVVPYPYLHVSSVYAYVHIRVYVLYTNSLSH